MAKENSPAPFSFPYVGTFFGTIRFLQECEMVILVVHPSEDGASFYRLIDDSHLTFIFSCRFIIYVREKQKCNAQENAIG